MTILITFPDGKVMNYKIVRGNRPHGFPPQQMYPDFRVGPHYTEAERTYGWTYAGPGGHDRIQMAENGMEFWLRLADGGSVRFVFLGPNFIGNREYRAVEVYDSHGLRTDLEYDSEGYLDTVTQEGGRFLKLHWDYRGAFPKKVIVGVDTGGPAGSQHVYYNYSTLAIPGSGNFLTLTSATYPNELGIGQDVSATYTYGSCFGSEPCSGAARSTFPLLKRADDPHYAGAMSTIRYAYAGDIGCFTDPSQPPWLHPDFYLPEPYSIAAEKNDNDVTAVSSFAINCLDGTRREDNGLGGWRRFYFGRSAETTEGPPGPSELSCRSFELGKVTDFTTESSITEALPKHRQNYFWGDPRHIWDAMENLPIEQLAAQGDDTGQPSDVFYAVDGHHEFYNRTALGESLPVDEGRMDKVNQHWLFSRSNELGQTVTYKRDERRRVVKITYPEQSEEIFEYNHLNQVTRHRLASGTSEHFEYNYRGLLWREWNDIDGLANAIY